MTVCKGSGLDTRLSHTWVRLMRVHFVVKRLASCHLL